MNTFSHCNFLSLKLSSYVVIYIVVQFILSYPAHAVGHSECVGLFSNIDEKSDTTHANGFSFLIKLPDSITVTIFEGPHYTVNAKNVRIKNKEFKFNFLDYGVEGRCLFDGIQARVKKDKIVSKNMFFNKKEHTEQFIHHPDSDLSIQQISKIPPAQSIFANKSEVMVFVYIGIAILVISFVNKFVKYFGFSRADSSAGVPTYEFIKCHNCNKVNRISLLMDSKAKKPVCGLCHSNLKELSSDEIPRGGKSCYGETTHRKKYQGPWSDSNEANKSEVPIDAVMDTEFSVRDISDKDQFHQDKGCGDNNSYYISSKKELDEYIDRLVSLSWSKAKSIKINTFPTRMFDDKTDDMSGFVTSVLSHVRKIAPFIEVPYLTPKVTFEKLVDAAGTFNEDDGWIKLCVDIAYINNPAAVKSILCHEICHYILGHNGIKIDDTLKNERLTETAMFVFGLGDIFLSGYKIVYSRNSHLYIGYLSANEYFYIKNKINYLWKLPDSGRSASDELLTLFKAIVPDQRTRLRYLQNEKKNHPNRSDDRNIVNIIEKLKRDRGWV